MAIFEQIQSDIKDAMRAKDKIKLTTLRSLISEGKKLAIDSGKDITDNDMATIIAKGIKTRQDSSIQYREAGREDLSDREDQEIEIYRLYQPKQLSEEEITAIVNGVISEVGASSPSDMGKVMGKLMPKVKGKADGSLVNSVVKKLLS